MRISTETGRPMLLALGTAEKNSGLVTQPCISVSPTSLSALLVTVPAHSNLWERNGWGGDSSGGRLRILTSQWKILQILWIIKNKNLVKGEPTARP